MIDLTYRRVSPFAVASATLGISATLGLLVPQLAVVAIPALIAAVVAWQLIHRYEECGNRWMWAGIACAGIVVLSVAGWPFVANWIENPKGYERLNFQSVVKGTQPALDSYIGENICLKGYVYPTTQRVMNQSLTLGSDAPSRDFGGDIGKNYVVVNLPAGETWEWTPSRVVVCGKLLRKRTTEYEPGRFHILYYLQADTIRSSQTVY